ncbi:MAG TPA: cupin domain-containing protein, partial [Candidatus Competibacteraceae bacterium]|nr:cupin domain-containing protein [Candidatus Competibacteraceae bacterium]
MSTPQRLIELLQLKPLPIEGGYFRRTYCSDETIARDALPARYSQARALGSAIYFLLHGAAFSALHRLRSDEIYHFYRGDPVELLLLFPDGSGEVRILGPALEAGQQPQVMAPHGVWQGSRLKPGGHYALMGTTLAPAYDPS